MFTTGVTAVEHEQRRVKEINLRLAEASWVKSKPNPNSKKNKALVNNEGKLINTRNRLAAILNEGHLSCDKNDTARLKDRSRLTFAAVKVTVAVATRPC